VRRWWVFAIVDIAKYLRIVHVEEGRRQEFPAKFTFMLDENPVRINVSKA
jgi:hypothetical protein